MPWLQAGGQAALELKKTGRGPPARPPFSESDSESPLPAGTAVPFPHCGDPHDSWPGYAPERRTVLVPVVAPS